MSLSQAISAAVSGLNATQSNLSLVAANVANADTPGYVRKTAGQVTISSDGISVRVASINRELDTYVQRQLQTETSGASYADLKAQIYGQLQGLYGTPGSSSALDTIFNNFTTALQALTTTPDDPSARIGVVSAAQAMTQQLNSVSDSIQGLREDAEQGISTSVASANSAMQHIAQINNQIASMSPTDSSRASLLDDRDGYVSQLAQLMDVNVVQGNNDQISVFTNSGVELVGAEAAKLNFTPQGSMSAAAQWNADPSKSSVGSITLTSVNGGTIDLIANNAIRSGQLAAYVEMRDQVLPQAQTQLDQFASAMSSALSDKTTDGTPVTVGPQSGFTVDTSGMLAGNSMTVTYTDALTKAQRQVTLVRVDDPSALPLSSTVTTNPNDTVVGINFSGGMGSITSQVQAALNGTGIAVSNTSGNTLQFLNTGAGSSAALGNVSSTITQTAFDSGNSQMPLFTDGGTPYTGALSSVGSQSAGLAGRISVNSAVVTDPSQLVLYQSGVDAGDITRPTFLYNQMTSATLGYSPDTGIGSVARPFNSTLSGYLQQVIGTQAQQASAATNLKQGQDVVLTSLQQRFNQSSAVNIDTEMSNLLTLQNNYSANARVLTTVQSMIDALLKM
jgi:flagellar hook-associated protein 1 FlgK